MSSHSRSTENRSAENISPADLVKSPAAGEMTAAPIVDAGKKMRDLQYPDMQSAMRFPIKLPISVKSKSGQSLTESQNISSNGVLFQMDSDMPIGSMVDFTISLPAQIVGADADVHLDCRGRVVRSSEDGGRRGVGVVIDEYRFGRR
jgi:PilZ domain-containing protein